MFVIRSRNRNCGHVRIDESQAFGGESYNHWIPVMTGVFAAVCVTLWVELGPIMDPFDLAVGQTNTYRRLVE